MGERAPWMMGLLARGGGRALLALWVAIAVLAGATQAGRTHWYCPAMQSVMTHACCRGGVTDLSSRAQASHAVNTAAWVAPKCCQTRSMASFDACTTTTHAAESSEPARGAVALPIRVIRVVGTCLGTSLRTAAASMRAGPEKLRLHARLMVFHA